MSWRGIAMRVVVLSLALAAAGASITMRAQVEGQRELRAAEVLASNGDLEGAIVRARASACWYVPNSTHVPQAYGRLASVARMAEGRGDLRTALFAWQAVRSAALATRVGVVLREQDLEQADANIARLSARIPRPALAADSNEQQLEKAMAAKLAASSQPRLGWVMVMVAGLAVMMGGAVQVVRSGISREGKLQWAAMRVAGVAAGIGMVFWLLSWWMA